MMDIQDRGKDGVEPILNRGNMKKKMTRNKNKKRKQRSKCTGRTKGGDWIIKIEQELD